MATGCISWEKQNSCSYASRYGYKNFFTVEWLVKLKKKELPKLPLMKNVFIQWNIYFYMDEQDHTDQMDNLQKYY